jgi:hypothetical protein
MKIRKKFYSTGHWYESCHRQRQREEGRNGLTRKSDDLAKVFSGHPTDRLLNVDGDDPEHDVDGQGEAVHLLHPGVKGIKLFTAEIYEFS